MACSAELRVINRVLEGLAGSDPVRDGLFRLEIGDGVVSDAGLSELSEEADGFTETIGLWLGLFGSAHGISGAIRRV